MPIPLPGRYLPVTLAATLLLTADGMVMADVIASQPPISGTTGPVIQTPVIHRLTRNRVRDANPQLRDNMIYWERFGDGQGDSEVFSFNTSGLTRERLTRNRRDDTLQAPNVWISSPIGSQRPFGAIVDLDSLSLDTDAIRRRNRESRLHEIFVGQNRRTRNKRYEASVQMADNPAHGMAWLSLKTPFGAQVLNSETTGFDVFWQNGRNRRTTRLTDTPDATSVAFGGPWVAWTTLDKHEVVFQHIRVGENKSIAVDSPANLGVSGSRIKFETPSEVALAPGVVINSVFESRVKVYDALTDTLIDVGDDASLGFHRDGQSVMSDRYVAYNRSFRDILNGAITATINPLPEVTELRLFDLDSAADILITEGSQISHVRISGDKLVWQMLDKSSPDRDQWDFEIFTYDIRKDLLRQVTDNLVDDLGPQVDGDVIVWQTTFADGSADIFYETQELIVSGGLIGGSLSPVSDQLEAMAVSADSARVVVPEPGAVALFALPCLYISVRRRSV